MYEDDGYQKNDSIRNNEVIIDNHLPGSSFISASKRDDDVGAHPAPSDDSDDGANWGDAAYTVLSATVSEINDRFNYAMTAGEIANALIADADATTDNSKKEFAWPYDYENRKKETSTATRFAIKNNDDASEIDFRFTHRTGAEQPVNPYVEWDVQEDATDHD